MGERELIGLAGNILSPGATPQVQVAAAELQPEGLLYL